MAKGTVGHLAHLKVLDLTDHRGALAGRILAQLGADVVQVEPLSGTDSRLQPPFDPDGDSLYWAAYGAGRRSIALDIKSDADRATFHDLVRRADILIETGNPSEDELLDYAELAALNPGLIHAVVTPFGLEGPKAKYADSELTVWAAGGPLLPVAAVADRPYRISVPQAYHHATMDAVQGALIAYYERKKSGLGQKVVVSAQASASQSTLSTTLAGPVGHPRFTLRKSVASMKNQPDLSGSGARTNKSKWHVQDGLVEMHLAMGPATGRFTNRLFEYLSEQGAKDVAEFVEWDWPTLQDRIVADEIDEEDLDRCRDCISTFMAPLNKFDAVEIALKEKVLMAPICTLEDQLRSKHLEARDFFVKVPYKGRSLIQPGPFARYIEGAYAPLGEAPKIGADGDAIRRDWLGQAPAVFSGSGQSESPLAGIKVLDLAWVVAGPMIGRNLADFGATVVRVESSKRVETARLLGPFPGGVVDKLRSAQFENCNTGKLGLSLDLGSAEAREVLLDLVEWADVVVESFAPGQMKRWGLNYEKLAERNPSIIMLSTSLMGQVGPWSKLAGFGNIGSAMSGYQQLVGPEGDLPVGPYGPYTDYVGPRFGLIALLAALDHREKTGQGGWMDVAQAETGMQGLADRFADYEVNGVVTECVGNRDPLIAPNNVYACIKDGYDDRWVAISCRTDEEWRRLADEVGGELAADTSLNTLAGRKANEDRIDAALEAWCATQQAIDVENRLQAKHIPAHLAASADDFYVDPQIESWGHFVSLPRANGEISVVEGCHWKLSRTPASPPRSSPDYGRDNDQVLREILHYDQGRIADLDKIGALT
ncbi:CoA transferase [Pseudooceanicola sp.]|uniref:CaiB/BaiF CoA-transferase family protein n=1 Tax=Pseudooceanicola sp. TaxID=1914328 RepID=UPI002631F710|nr:CoA transferase [Pseudooceanicola sp.]MDF1854071.1 CoA transferase [Pseudooceanicola sp.]